MAVLITPEILAIISGNTDRVGQVIPLAGKDFTWEILESLKPMRTSQKTLLHAQGPSAT